jgi:folate-binding protein YgfZ
METLALHEFHEGLGGRFAAVGGAEAVASYGDPPAEHAALRQTAGILDLSFRSRLVLTGADRVRFLHGQVTNDVKALRGGAGCYAALTTAKGRMQSDLYIYCLADELLLDFEPGLAAAVSQRLEKYIVADDAQVVDAAPHYGLISAQGPKAEAVVRALGLANDLPAKPLGFLKIEDATLGEIYLMNQPRLGTSGFDLFVPAAALGAVADKLIAGAKAIGGRVCGWQAFETARVEAGIPRFGMDMDETNFPQECGIEARAVSYNKGCYIGQETLNRIHTMGHVNRALCGLRLADDLKSLPAKGERLLAAGKEVGHVTSAVRSLALNANIALALVRNETNQIGAEFTLATAEGQSSARISALPFGEV